MLRIKNKNPKYGPFIYSITRFLRDFQMKALHSDGIVEPRASAILYMVDSSMLKFVKGTVRVVTEGIAIGQTIMPAYEFQSQLPPWKGKPFVSAAFDVDTKRFFKLYEAIMEGKQQ
jgi:inosine-uridine nucleoside N-ribohydrolase